MDSTQTAQCSEGIVNSSTKATKPSFGADLTDVLLLAVIETIADIHTIQFQRQVGSFTPGPGVERLGNALNLQCITAGGVQMLVSRWRRRDVTSLLVPSRPVQYEQPLSFSSSDRMFSACYAQDWGLLDQNQCVTIDDDRKLRMINLAKLFGPDSERKDMLGEYHFTEVINSLSAAKAAGHLVCARNGKELHRRILMRDASAW
ncbi:hypothetical protein DFH05DRAFT_1461664 [Lentinula detonsa]|uniref:Uncharacterized protein n=1 Tax=Lentinula detonsa TaxID=2804962 RepID=A0A9W8NX99_9AGAR|nr:hypothetical protein DFH05DRAFT_1461664 [Lentinula detonsa]